VLGDRCLSQHNETSRHGTSPPAPQLTHLLSALSTSSSGRPLSASFTILNLGVQQCQRSHVRSLACAHTPLHWPVPQHLGHCLHGLYDPHTGLSILRYAMRAQQTPVPSRPPPAYLYSMSPPLRSSSPVPVPLMPSFSQCQLNVMTVSTCVGQRHRECRSALWIAVTLVCLAGARPWSMNAHAY
jgi:hypothetical protein